MTSDLPHNPTQRGRDPLASDVRADERIALRVLAPAIAGVQTMIADRWINGSPQSAEEPKSEKVMFPPPARATADSDSKASATDRTNPARET